MDAHGWLDAGGADGGSAIVAAVPAAAVASAGAAEVVAKHPSEVITRQQAVARQQERRNAGRLARERDSIDPMDPVRSICQRPSSTLHAARCP